VTLHVRQENGSWEVWLDDEFAEPFKGSKLAVGWTLPVALDLALKELQRKVGELENAAYDGAAGMFVKEGGHD
jgi:hypothetical protein